MSNDKVNWEQARVDAAISAMQGIVANTHDRDYRVRERYSSYDSWRKEYPDEIAKNRCGSCRCPHCRVEKD